MAVSAITSLKSIIGYKGNSGKSSGPRDDSLDPVPTGGFRVGYKRNTNELQVRILGARHLPVKIGKTPTSGYSVKLRLFPGREKYETESKPESWPVYNEDFTFEISNVVVKKGKQLSEILNASNFIIFTVYAEESLKKKKTVVGAANWKLDHKLFAHKPHTVDYGDNEELETPDIWREARELTSGIDGVKQMRDEKNNQLEVSLRYDPGNPEEGEEDILTLGVTKLRWSLEATKEYEQKNAQLYVKLKVLEFGDRIIKTSKTKRFPPSISVHFRPEKDNSILTVPLPANRDDISCQVSLCTNPAMGKKIVFGRKLIGPSHEAFGDAAEHWERAFRTPRVTVTQWHSIR